LKTIKQRDKIRVCAIQMDCVLGDKKANMAKVEEYLAEAASNRCDLIVFPELFLTGYSVEEHDLALAEKLPGPTTRKLCALAQKSNMFIAGAIIEASRIKGVIHDTAFLLGPEDLVGIYRKVHLWDRENIRFARGDQFPVFHTSIGCVGLQICYEIGFPKPARLLTFKGAEILLYPSAFGAPRRYAWDIATRSRALENGVFVIAANRSGQDKDTVFAGNTRIIDPTGGIMGEADRNNQLIIADLDTSLIVKQRQAIPYLRDLYRPVVFRSLLSNSSERDGN